MYQRISKENSWYPESREDVSKGKERERQLI